MEYKVSQGKSCNLKENELVFIWWYMFQIETEVHYIIYLSATNEI